MKDKILMLIIGILIGAILATGGFLICNKSNTKNVPSNLEENFQMRNDGGRQKGEKPNDQRPDGKMLDGGIPDDEEMLDGEKTEGEPPAKPSDDNANVANNEVSEL